MTAAAWNEGEEDVQRAYREWVRAHHPDRGGDPAVFVAGLARWQTHRTAARSGCRPRGELVRVCVFRSRGGLWQVARWWRRRRPQVRRVL